MDVSTDVQVSEVTVPPPVIPSCIFCFKSCHADEDRQNESTEELGGVQKIQNIFFKVVLRYFDYKKCSEGSPKGYFERLSFPKESWKLGCCLDCTTLVKCYVLSRVLPK